VSSAVRVASFSAIAPTPFRGQSLMLPVEQGNGEAEMILLRSTCKV